MPKFEELSPVLTLQMEADRRSGNRPPYGFDDRKAVRRLALPEDRPRIWMPPFVSDVGKIMTCPYYNRYTDKTQVFSLMKNDDISRRSLHVQLVSRIARTLGSALQLNLDLIEAIALGHDIGHPPFAHSGEVYLDQLYRQHTGLRFCHNIHSVRVLDQIFPLNLSLQVLDGIACHNGEVELEEYTPIPVDSFEAFDAMLQRCREDKLYANRIMPSTLEGSVVRISDIIAYLSKDRQDALRLKRIEEDAFANGEIGTVDEEILHNLMVNVIENSYAKPYIKLDARHFAALKASKRDNYHVIYESEATRVKLNATAKPMMEEIYGQLLEDLTQGRKNSPIFTHHIDYVNQVPCHRLTPYEKTEPNQMVVDYIASMTDDYFIDLHHYLFPDSGYKVEYQGYFD